MAITHGQSLRNGFAQSVLDAIDAGASFGKLRLFNASAVLLVEGNLNDPAMVRTDEVLNLSGTPLNLTAVANGTITNFQITDSDDNVVYSGSCGIAAGSPDLEIDNADVVNGQIITVLSHSYTAAV